MHNVSLLEGIRARAGASTQYIDSLVLPSAEPIPGGEDNKHIPAVDQ